MFIANLTYLKPLAMVDLHLQDHVAFLDRHYASGHFICSGRKIPRVGGVILCKADSLEEMQEILQEDPFYRHEIAFYEITQFTASKCGHGLDGLLD